MPFLTQQRKLSPTQMAPVVKDKLVSLKSPGKGVVGEEDFHVGFQKSGSSHLPSVHPLGFKQPHRRLQPAGWRGRAKGGLQGLCSGSHLEVAPFSIDHTAVAWPLRASEKPGNAVELCALQTPCHRGKLLLSPSHLE